MAKAKTYISVPKTVEAIQYDGLNFDEILAFCPHAQPDGNCVDVGPKNEFRLTAQSGDFIVKDSNENFFVCRGKEFKKSFKEIDLEREYACASTMY